MIQGWCKTSKYQNWISSECFDDVGVGLGSPHWGGTNWSISSPQSPPKTNPNQPNPCINLFSYISCIFVYLSENFRIYSQSRLNTNTKPTFVLEFKLVWPMCTVFPKGLPGNHCQHLLILFFYPFPHLSVQRWKRTCVFLLGRSHHLCQVLAITIIIATINITITIII